MTTTSGEVRSAALDSAKLTVRQQLATDIAVLQAEGTLAPHQVPPPPKPVSKGRGFLTVVAMLLTFGVITFLGEACRVWWWPKEHLGESFLGVLLTLVIELFLIIGSPIIGLVAAAVVGGVRAAHAVQDARDHVVADYVHRFWTEREWIRQQLAARALDHSTALAMLQGREAPVAAIRSLGTGSALSEAAQFVPPPPPKPVSRTRKVLRFLGGGIALLFVGAMVIAEITDPDVSAADLGSGQDTGPAKPVRTALSDGSIREARAVLAADAEALAAGRPMIELSAPPEPAVRKTGMLQGWGLGKTALLFLVLWAGCTVVVRSWSSDSGPSGNDTVDAIGTILSWAMILLLALIGALFLMGIAFLVYSHAYEARAAGDKDADSADRLRRDFWRERETLRTGIASGRWRADEVLAILRGVAPAPPTIARVLQAED